MSSTRSIRTRRRAQSALVALAVAAGVFAAAPSAHAASQFTVDLSVNTGALRYGATGFLYGLGDEGIPNQVMLSTLKPRVTAQKAPDGLQHPNGDALKIAPMWKRVGGGDIQIYMQDIYQQWPYENLGINDYLAKVDTMVRKVVADPNRSSYVYVPFNEPDGIWYQNNVNGLAADWKLVYDKIRSIDATARIAGPNFASYRAADMRTFMTLAKNNNALPHVTTWHELGNDFFTSWDAHLADYRDIESDLAISQRPVSINEYARSSGDLGVPGNLVQYVARFENSKVDGCLAYWTTAGGLNDLVTRNSQATGGWWLYKWYGELTGNTVGVTPPSPSSSLQGLAALDAAKKQARVILGGNNPASGTYDTNVVVKGFGAASYLGTSVHAMVFGVDTTGLNASSGQYLVTEGDFTVSGGQITVPLTGLKGTSAYQVVITPNKDTTTAGSTTRYEAEYAALSGSAQVAYGTNTGYSGTYFTEGYGASSNASTKFVVTAATDGYYNVGLRYSAGPLTGAPANRSIRLRLNGVDLATPALPGTANWNTWNTVTTKVFLTAGINQIEVNAYTGDDADAINVDYLDVVATTGTITAYQAESSANTRSGTAAVGSNTAASGGQYVGFVGNGAGNTLRFNNVTVSAAGRYRMVVTYANGELGAGATNYNSNIVDRYADISVNGAAAKRSYFRNTLGWSNFRTTVVDVDLAAGANTITFANAAAYAPDLDLIQIAAPVG
ncbi:carbohydrate-binding protein [Catellatospora tritici]|uniref:carbohydrate-binding protein n=1 Tax=Catellatospora tritici TaxID=2851566 RepID=UPI001C2CDE4F|nr:carbohydrate-binding protein [Catellatospora tritici]MBV1855210.1 carbohydrate-binding protein [Catellatospora tritici]